MDLDEVILDVMPVDVDMTEVCDRIAAEKGKLLQEKEQLKEMQQELLRYVAKQNNKLKMLTQEISQIDGETTRLKVRDKLHLAEHSQHRDDITVVKSQMQNIEKAIAEINKSLVETVLKFEGDCKGIAAKLRNNYDNQRRDILRKDLEREKARELEVNIKKRGLEEDIARWLKRNGLTADIEKMKKGEEQAVTALPGSELDNINKAVDNLPYVTNQMRKERIALNEKQQKMADLKAKIAELRSSTLYQ